MAITFGAPVLTPATANNSSVGPVPLVQTGVGDLNAMFVCANGGVGQRSSRD